MATSKAKEKYVLATDGITFEAEELESGESVFCPMGFGEEALENP